LLGLLQRREKQRESLGARALFQRDLPAELQHQRGFASQARGLCNASRALQRGQSARVLAATTRKNSLGDQRTGDQRRVADLLCEKEAAADRCLRLGPLRKEGVSDTEVQTVAGKLRVVTGGFVEALSLLIVADGF